METRSVIGSDCLTLFDDIAADISREMSGESSTSTFTETITTEFTPPDQQLWMDIAVAAARVESYDLPEFPAIVANTTLDAFNTRFPAAKP